MGSYLNPGSERFRTGLGSAIYVDKTMLMYVRRMLSILLVATVLFGMQTSKGESVRNHDEKIINVINALNCPILVSEISDQRYGSYAVIEASGLDFIQSWELDGGTIELYKGEQSDYLAVLRSENRVYCAQYVNGFEAENQDESAAIPSNAYYHSIEASASGIYVRTEIAFFIDHQYIRQIFWNPDDPEPSHVSFGDSECILRDADILF